MIQRKKGKRWKRLTKLRAGGNRVFAGKTRVRRTWRLRAKFGREKSLGYRVR